MRALGGSWRRRESRIRMHVREVQTDGRRLVQHQIAVHEHRDLPVRVELQEVSRLVRSVGAVHQRELERHAELLEQHVRRQAGIAGIVVQPDVADVRHGAGELEVD